MLAIHGGTILSIKDLIAILPPKGLTGLQADGIGSRITAENLRIAALDFGQTGIVGVRSTNGGLVNLDGGKIEIVGDKSFGLFADNGIIRAKGALTISMKGVDSHGIEAHGSGLVEIAPNTTITTSGAGGFGIFAFNGGTVIANGITISTSGLLSPLGFDADGAAALGGTIRLGNSSIRTHGDNADGLHVFDGNSRIFGTNLTIETSGLAAAGAEAENGGLIQLNGGSITTAGVNAYGALVSGIGSRVVFTDSDVLSSKGSGASVANGASLTLAGSSLTAFLHGIVATGGTAQTPDSIVMSDGNLITVLGDAFQVQNGVANITVSNAATVTGNSALLRVLDPLSPTVVNFTADHASLFGDIFADPASKTTFNLTNSSVLTGKVNPPPFGVGVDMTVDGSSQWVMTGSSDLKSLSVGPGASILFRPPLFGLHSTLTIASLLGTGGNFGLNVDLRHAVGDLIDITGRSEGSHFLTFSDRGRGANLRSTEALLVVKTSDGIAGFSGMTDRGVFKYFVVHGNGSTATPVPDDWYLVRADKIVQDQITRPEHAFPGSINTPVGLSSVDALSNAANAAIGTYAGGIPLFYADMDTLIQRLGELRFPGTDRSDSVDSNGKAVISPAPPEETYSTVGTWVRGFGNGMHINDQVSRAFDQNTGGFQLGGDKRLGLFQGDLYLGGFLGYFNASRDFLDGGNGSTNAFSVGTYATWIDPKGWYADLVLKYTQLWNYFRAPSSDGSFTTQNYSIPSLGGSLEVGKRFDVGKFFIEPQAQLAGAWEAGNNYTTSDGLAVGGSDQFSLRGRLGLRAGMDFTFSNGIVLEPYCKISAIHEFLTGDRITLDDIGFNPTLSGTLVDAGAGLAVRLNRSVYLYGEYDYANGDKIRQPWAVNAGLRWQWGGKPEEAMAERPLAKQLTGKEEAKMVEQPPAKIPEPWEIKVGGPGWLANVTGTTGFHGVNSNISVDVGQILRHLNVIYTFSGEVRRGRFGVSGELGYLNGQAGVPGTGLVSKVDLGLQQFLGGFHGTWRVVQGPRGWLDMLAGFRYTYLGQQVGLQANNLAIDTASTQLVDQVSAPGSNVRTLVQQNIVNKLDSLLGRNPTLPVAPIAGGHRETIRNLIEQLVAQRQPELVAAFRTGAQARLNQLKAQLASQISNTLTGQLNRSFSFYDDWFDPVIGLRGRLNLNKAFYLTAESDVGGFGIGSDIAVQAYGALGCQITRHIYSEVGYRYLYDEFRDESAGDFLYKMSLHGAQITAGINF
ncbi:MAG TPA: autotransporter outer membrane beta-barrel domain-containing protein [Chthoniobacterales bacterium]|nr:autotransporter outer membrane beta-barrel domain-containing protein [Chthoniobacterales bacterium]